MRSRTTTLFRSQTVAMATIIKDHVRGQSRENDIKVACH